MNNLVYFDSVVESGVDFILAHVPGPTFPRHVSTAASNGAQFSVGSRQELLEAAARSDFIDCRINAYPEYTEHKGIQRQAPDFLFIDLDRSTFKSDDDHAGALTETLGNIKNTISRQAEPTVIWSGNGYHIYLPLDNAVVLENVTEYGKFDNPSIKFLRFAEHRLSGGKCDPSHKPSFKSCMLRIPGSFNGKCILAGKDAEVRIIQRWNAYRSKLPLQFMKEFYSWLMDEKIAELKRQKSLSKYQKVGESPGTVPWIEALLQTPIDDYRKTALALIVAPYLINIKRLSYPDAFASIKAWLARCDQARRLDSNFKGRIKTALETAARDHRLPMRLETLQSRNRQLYDVLKPEIY